MPHSVCPCSLPPSCLLPLASTQPRLMQVVILSPHGYFGQTNVLGMPDTGGQVRTDARVGGGGAWQGSWMLHLGRGRARGVCLGRPGTQGRGMATGPLQNGELQPCNSVHYEYVPTRTRYPQHDLSGIVSALAPRSS